MPQSHMCKNATHGETEFVCKPAAILYNPFRIYLSTTWLTWSYIPVDQLYLLEVGINSTIGEQTPGHDLVFNIKNLATDLDQCERSSLHPPCTCQMISSPLSRHDLCMGFPLVGSSNKALMNCMVNGWRLPDNVKVIVGFDICSGYRNPKK